MNRSKGRILALAQTASVLALVLAATRVWADEAKPAEAAPLETAPLETATAAPAADLASASADLAVSSADLAAVTVYARRRGEKISDVPLAVSVVGGDKITKSGQLLGANDIVQFVPNAQALQPHGPSRARWFIRGIGTNNTGANTINPVGIYYDDVYIANIQNQGYPLFDLDHVEVLNGPQGTLWGKNSNGGAINFVSRAPTFDTNGYGEASYGSDGEKVAQGAVGGALVGDKVAGRISFYYRGFDGWQNNQITGQKHGGGTEFATRGQLLFKPTDNLSVQLNVHTRSNSNLNFGSSFQASTFQPLTAGTATQRAFLSVYPNGLPLLGRGETQTVDQNPETIQASGANAKVNWDLGWATLTSITAFEENLVNGGDGGNLIPANSPYAGQGPFTLSWVDSSSRQLTQELRLTSRDGGRLTWLAGLYGFTGRINTRTVVANYIRGTTTGTTNAWGNGPQFTDTDYGQNTDNYAVFGSLGYSVTDRFKVSLGARWSHEKNTIDWTYGAANTAGTAASFIPNLPRTSIQLYQPRDLVFTDSDAQKVNALTYDISPEYKINDDVKAYARFAHGVLPGGYTSTGYVAVPGTAIRANQIFALEPEKIDAYEVGLKTRWFDGRLTADLAGFYYDYKNLVVNVPTVLDPANPTIATVIFRNAGAAKIKGLELRFDATPVERLNISGSVGYLDTEYTRDIGTTATILGAQAPRSPHLTANLSITYVQPLPSGSLEFGLDARHSSKFFFYPTIASQITAPDPVLQQKAFNVLNGRVRWNIGDDDRFAVQLAVLNLTDEKYKTHSLPISNGVSNQMYGRPRSVLATVSARF